MTYYHETLKMIKERKLDIAAQFEAECMKLLRSGAIDRESHNRSVLFGVAIENIADRYNIRTSTDYKNLKQF